MSSPLTLEHLVVRALTPLRRRPERWLLAVSGGADSIVMAEILNRWRRYLRVELAVAHVHHGIGADAGQNRFRLKAQQVARNWARNRNATFYTNRPEAVAFQSEAELRAWRRRHLRRWLRAGAFDRLVFAHHADDLTETRLLRLIRGAGAQGLKAMAIERGRVLRPLLQASRGEILAYAAGRRLEWIEDPSNQLTTSMRNWLRQEWLPQLERRSPGASKSLSRSLTTLAVNEFTETIGPFVGLRRAPLEEFTSARREDIVARYLRSVGIKGYSRTHVRELLKRLSSQAKTTRFEMLGFSFQANPDFLWASRV